MADLVIPGFGILSYVPNFKPCDPGLTGYMDWHEWAKVQPEPV